MTDGLDFTPLTLAEVGRNTETRTSLLDEVNAALQKLGHECLDEGTDGAAKVTITIAIRRTQTASLSYDPTIKVSPPGQRMTGSLGMVDRSTGQITTQRTDQIPLPMGSVTVTMGTKTRT